MTIKGGTRVGLLEHCITSSSILNQSSIYCIKERCTGVYSAIHIAVKPRTCTVFKGAFQPRAIHGYGDFQE